MNNSYERSGLLTSIVGSLLFGSLGITFAIFTGSQAVLLDGAFNLVAALMAFIGLKIANSLERPETEHYPIGFYALEPLFVLGKGLILLLLTTYVIVNNVIIMINGGNELNLGLVLIYLSVALVGNMIVYFRIRSKNVKTSSPILAIETENWKINVAITGGIALAILISFLLRDSFLKDYLRYVDQVIVIIVATLSLPVPVTAIKEGLGDLLLFAPPDETRNKIREAVLEEMDQFKTVDCRHFLMLKTGRKIWISLFIYSDEPSIPTDLPDQIKDRLSTRIGQDYEACNVDVLLTSQ